MVNLNTVAATTCLHSRSVLPHPTHYLKAYQGRQS